MLRRQFQEEPVTLLGATTGPAGPLGGKGTVTYSPASTYDGLVTPLGAEEAARLGLSATVERFRVRLPAGVLVRPADRLHFRGRDWNVTLSTSYTSYTRVIVEGVS